MWEYKEFKKVLLVIAMILVFINFLVMFGLACYVGAPTYPVDVDSIVLQIMTVIYPFILLIFAIVFIHKDCSSYISYIVFGLFVFLPVPTLLIIGLILSPETKYLWYAWLVFSDTLLALVVYIGVAMVHRKIDKT